jgi:hypothetical protein
MENHCFYQWAIASIAILNYQGVAMDPTVPTAIPSGNQTWQWKNPHG